jgi:hypothetical protein
MPISERRSFIPPSAEADPVREKYIDSKLKALRLLGKQWPKATGPHKRLAAGERWVFRDDARGVA